MWHTWQQKTFGVFPTLLSEVKPRPFPGRTASDLTMESTVLSQSLSPWPLHRTCCVCLVTQWCPTLCDPVDCSPPGFSLSLGILQVGILEWVAMPFSRESSQPRTQHCGQILYHLSHQGSQRITEWVAYPSSRGSSQPKNRTRVSCIAGGFLTSRATREAYTEWVLRGKAEEAPDAEWLQGQSITCMREEKLPQTTKT